MISAVLALQTAVKSLLSADATLTSAIGAARIYDGAPRDAAVPFVSLDEIVTRRRDGLAAMLEEHRFTLRIWSKAGGKREAVAIADRIVALLDDAQPALSGHRVVRLYLETSDARVAKDRVATETALRFVALTEPIG
ncbi:MAG: DUF3168 domain-containing protein [Ancalomicrobiaceae bacterium]|nr:DUF3168 domain-containing protein [Ancalomicrobiaceae bacterium]